MYLRIVCLYFWQFVCSTTNPPFWNGFYYISPNGKTRRRRRKKTFPCSQAMFRLSNHHQLLCVGRWLMKYFLPLPFLVQLVCFFFVHFVIIHFAIKGIRSCRILLLSSIYPNGKSISSIVRSVYRLMLMFEWCGHYFSLSFILLGILSFGLIEKLSFRAEEFADGISFIKNPFKWNAKIRFFFFFF